MIVSLLDHPVVTRILNILQHPFKIFPERKGGFLSSCCSYFSVANLLIFSLATSFDSDGRPLDPGFYTGSPAYHSLIYQIFRYSAELSRPPDSLEGSRQPLPIRDEEIREREGPKVWIKKDAMENVIAEELSDQQVSLSFSEQV